MILRVFGNGNLSYNKKEVIKKGGYWRFRNFMGTMKTPVKTPLMNRHTIF